MAMDSRTRWFALYVVALSLKLLPPVRGPAAAGRLTSPAR